MKKNQRVPVLLLVFVLMFSNFFQFGSVFAEEDTGGGVLPTTAVIDPTVLKDFTATVKQEGVPIPEAGTITSDKSIRVDLSFGIPVQGDDPTPPNPVKKGDTISFAVSNAFTLLSSASIELKMGTTKVGTATFTTDPATKMVTANVLFDGDDLVFDGTSNTVTVQFGGDFEYDDSGASGSTGDHIVSILEKNYTVNVPALPIIYDVSKTGIANLAEQSIAWTVNIGATQGGTPVDLAGYQFFDDLQNVGEYITDSFQVDGGDVSPDTADNDLRYVFPTSSTSPKTITFKTKIPDSKYYATGQQNVTNKAQLQDSTMTMMAEDQVTVSFTPTWITKSGVSSDAGSSGVYDPTSRTITWTITANQMAATLPNAVITDVLPAGLTLASAKWQKWNGTTWIDDNSITPNVSGEFALGNINTMILLTIVTNVPPDAYTTGTTQYSNSANIRWDGGPGTGLGSGSFTVPIGYNAITKSGVADPANQKIRWTVNVDTKGQSIPVLKVYDLLVYGNSINLGTVSGIPGGIATGDLTPRFGQKYAGDFVVSGAAGNTVTVIPIMQGATRVADLLEITNLSTTAVNTFSFDSQVVDPNIFAGNKDSNVLNTATLFSATTKLNAATATVSYTNRMLRKELLKREAMTDPADSVNSQRTRTASAGFDYQDKSAIFRLSVNADGIDLTNTTNAAGETLGVATLTDTLPAGWEFVDIASGSQYLIFEGIGQADRTVIATDTTPDPVAGLTASFSGQTASFTFTTLNQPYVILVKAKPTSATLADYFNANKTTTPTNSTTLKTEKWISGVSSSQNVSITSQILVKNTTQPAAGELRWSVDYKPYDLPQPGERLEDQLPLGIDLRTDATGNLLLTGNITVNEMTLNANGTYTLGNPVALVLGSNVSYDNATRVLSFIIPNSAKAYRFSYLTDITGVPGTITNKVSLFGSSTELEDTSKSYVITAADGSASLLRNGWISINKTDGDGNSLAGAEFTLYAMDNTTVIKQGITGSDGTVKLKVIPDGTYILRETKAPAGYTLENVNHSLTVTTSGTTVTSSIDGKTGADANTLNVKNFTANTAGNLTISKAVAGAGADTTKTFAFTLTLEGATGTYSYIGQGVPSGTIASGGTISLAHGQSITVVGLPKEATYTVTEADYAGDGYTASKTGETGTIEADKTQTAAFTNTRTVGNLTISKTVAGNAGDTTKKFDFTLTLVGSGANKTYAYTGYGVSDGTIASGGTVSLADGQSITIAELPEGITYKVEEADYSSDGYIMTSTGDGETGAIEADKTKSVAFKNTRNIGALTIFKKVVGNAGDTAKKFEFTLTLTGIGAAGNHAYTGNGVPDGNIASGDTISLAHGQSITILELPNGTTYEVEERDYSGDWYTTTSTGETGTIATDTTQTALFTNTKTVGNLTISKTVAGNAGDTAKEFDFTLTLSGNGANRTYEYTGTGVANGKIKSGDTVSLADGQSITISELPHGITYTVTEADYSGDGYIKASTGATGSIVTDTTQTASFTNTRNIFSPTRNLTIIKVDNQDNTKRLQGTEFALYDETKTNIIKTGTTDVNGEVTFTNILFGNYQIKEIKAADGYAITDEWIPVAINLLPLVGPLEITIGNDKITPGSVILTKVDQEDNTIKLPGAIFKLLDEQGKVVKETLTTNEVGQIIVSDLSPGNYQLIETAAPSGYLIDATPLPFEIQASHQEALRIVKTNKIIETVLKKGDITSKTGLPGCEITIYDKNGKEVRKVVTGADGTIVIKGLPAGNYTFKETRAPIGYTISRQTYRFSIDANGVLTGDNDLYDEKTKVVLTKLDASTSQPLAGAELTIFDVSGKEMSRNFTGADGKIVVEALPVGTYTFKETKAPEGYAINDQTFSFTIDEDGIVTGDTTLTNQRLTVIPENPVGIGGGTGTIPNDRNGEENTLTDGQMKYGSSSNPKTGGPTPEMIGLVSLALIMLTGLGIRNKRNKILRKK